MIEGRRHSSYILHSPLLEHCGIILFMCINKNHNEIPIKKADVSITNVHHHIVSEAILPVAYSSLLETIVGPVGMR